MNTLENLTNIVESILFGAGRPMRLSEIRSLLGTQNIDAELPKIKIAINADLETFGQYLKNYLYHGGL